MAKTKLLREKMCDKVLSAIHKHPGCKGVKEVSISDVADTDADCTWRVTVIDSGAVEFAKARQVAVMVQNELRQHYDLQTNK